MEPIGEFPAEGKQNPFPAVPLKADTRSATDNTNWVVPLWILASMALGILLFYASVIFLWLACSFLLFALVDPWIQKLHRRGVAPFVSALLLITLVLVVIAGCGFLAYDSYPSIKTEFGSYQKTVMHLYQSSSATFSKWSRSLRHLPLAGDATGVAAPAPEGESSAPIGGAIGASMLRGLGSAVTGMTFAILCPILTFFLIAERKTFATVFKSGFLKPEQAELIWDKITRSTGAFFVGNLVLLAISVPVFFALFSFFGVASALPMAAVSSVFNLIPFVGALLSGFLPSLSLISHGGNPGAAMGLYGCCVVIHFMVANLVTPKILGSKVDLNATASTIALIAWGEFWGGFGLLLAIPLTSAIKILFENSGNERLYWLAMLMSEDPESSLSRGYQQFLPTRAWKLKTEAAKETAKEKAYEGKTEPVSKSTPPLVPQPAPKAPLRAPPEPSQPSI